MFRIRFHGRGGQGIKTASRILGSAFFHDGFAVQDAPVYGAERRGAPMVAYVRAARDSIRERGVINNPDLVVVGDETLIPIPSANVLFGVAPRTVLLIASSIPPEVWRHQLELAGPIVTIPVGPASLKHTPALHMGASCAGAAAQLVGCITPDSLMRAIRDELREMPETVRDANIEQALAAYDAMEPSAGVVSESGEISARDYAHPGWVDVAVELAPLSAPDIRAPSTSMEVRTGAWRTMRPVIDPTRCNRCTWVCSTLCPDSAIRVTADGRPEIDYDHCKGCLVCVAVCPHHAIEAESEPAHVEAPA